MLADLIESRRDELVERWTDAVAACYGPPRNIPARPPLRGGNKDAAPALFLLITFLFLNQG